MKGGSFVRRVVCLCLGSLSLMVAASNAAAVGVSASSESPQIREALARQLPSPGPTVATKGGSGGQGDSQAPAGTPVMSLATASSDTWRTPEGSLVTRFYSTPVNFRSSGGAWHAIENQLVGSPLGGYENASNSFALRLPDSLSSSVTLEAGGRTLAFSLQHAATSTPSVSGETATYSEVLPATDLAYTSESSGVREVATLTGAEAPSQLRYTLQLPSGLTARTRPDGSITIGKGAGTLFTIPAPVAYRPGTGPSTGRSLPMSVGSEDGATTITVDTGEAWLREMLATGPVSIDPSVTVSGNQACSITEDTPKVGYCASSEFQVGYDSTHKEHHGLLRFELSSLPQGALVLNAKLGLYVQAKSTSNSKAVGVYRVTKPWTTSASWETYDGTHAWSAPGGDYNNPTENSDAVVNPSVGASTGWYYWYPTKMVQEWANGQPEHEGAANEGLIVKDQTDNTTANLLTVSSPTGSSNHPYLEVTYDNRGVGLSSQYTQLSTPLTDKLSMSVNVASGNLLLADDMMSIPGIDGLDYNSTIYFNSLDPDIHDVGRWRESMFIELTEYANGDIMTGNNTGAHYLFQKKSSGGYTTPPGIKAKMCTAATEAEAPCKKLPTGVSYRLQYEDPSEDYVDFSSFGWVKDIGDKYEPKLTANYTEGVDAITSWTDSRGRTIKYKVAPNSFYTEAKDESGSRNVKYELESESEGYAQLLASTDADGHTTKYHYEYGNLDKVTDPKGNVTKFIYNSDHTIKEVIRGYGTEQESTTKFEYKKVGEAPSPCSSTQKATIVKDPDWVEVGAHEALYCANVLDEVEKTAQATGAHEGKPVFGNETSFKFNPFGDLTSTTAAAPGTGESGGVNDLKYDATGTNVECAVSGNTKSSEESCPLRSSEEGRKSLITNYSYGDAANMFQATQTEDPQTHSVNSCFNGNTSGCGTTAEGQPAGSLKTKANELGSEKELSYTYNKNGTVATSVDARKLTTEYKYDGSWNLKEIVPPSGSEIGKTTIKVDADSRPEVIEDGAKHRETISYDKDDRITKIVYSGTGAEKTVNFEYDADGNLLKREDSIGTTKYTVDPLNRVTKEELPGSVTNSYGYDRASNMSSFADAGGTTSYAYNGLDELESMTEPASIGTDTFSYDNDHRLTKVKYASGAAEAYKLDPATGRTEQITPEGLSGATVPTLSYKYMAKEGEPEKEANTGLIQKLVESPGGTTTYSYDELNRLKKAVTGGTASPAFYKFTYDGDGNRTEQKVNTSSESETGAKATYYGYNNGNELLCRQTVALVEGKCSGNSTTELSHYSYDGAGEETAITPESDTTGSSFAYNAASELSTLTPSGESGIGLGYGGTGQDDLTSKGSSTTLDNSLLGLTREVVSGGGYSFERTPEGLLVDIRTPAGNYNPLYDAQGDVIGLVSSAKKVERTFHYGPYGENVKSEGTATVPFIFGYKGGYRMLGGNKGETSVANGLYHYGQRFYDPTTGRWTQRDPAARISIGSGLYGFTVNDPINEGDPTGLSSSSEEKCAAAGGAVGVIVSTATDTEATGFLADAGFEAGCDVGAWQNEEEGHRGLVIEAVEGTKEGVEGAGEWIREEILE